MMKAQAEGGTPLQRAGPIFASISRPPPATDMTGRLIAAQWDPWPFEAAIKQDIGASDIYTLRRITPSDRGKGWDKT